MLLLRSPVPLVVAALLLAVPGFAQTGHSSDKGCAEAVRYPESRDVLTPEEELEEMYKALNDSIGRYERCFNRSSTAASATESGSGEGQAAGEDHTAETEQAAKDSEGAETEQAAKDSEGAELESVASSSISGTEAPQGTEGQTGADISKQGPAAGNGLPPADIPPTDNDAYIAAQLREAAEAETDPELKAELWKEYRKYKNLPQDKNVPQAP